MYKINFKEGSKLRGFSQAFRDVVLLILTVTVIVNAHCYSVLINKSYEPLLVTKVEEQSLSITKLENEVLRQGAEVDSLLVNPRELMDANVMIFTDDAKGSGSVIRVEEDYTYILTAAHVVSSTKVGMGKDGALDYLNTAATDITIFYGKAFKQKVRAQVQKIDYEFDLAVLKVFKKLDIIPIRVSKVEPELGETVWSLSNPGEQSGVINKGILSNIDEDYAYVALGGFFGSSGGMCLNNNGEQIGVIHTVVIARIGGFIPSLTVYNGVTKIADLNDFLKGLIK